MPTVLMDDPYRLIFFLVQTKVNRLIFMFCGKEELPNSGLTLFT
jgi:hypothetical protein